MIGLVFDFHRLLRNLERTEAVHHHRQLVGVLGANARLGAARVRTVRNAVGMMGDAPEFNSLPAHELARRVVQHLVRIHVAVIVRCRNRLGVKIVRPRTERADDEAIALKSLMHRRRLVNPANDRLEIPDVERPRVEVSIPSNDVEWVVIENDLVDPVILLDVQREIAFFVVRGELHRPTDVALGVRGTLHELTKIVSVAGRGADVASALDHKKLRLLPVQVHLVSVENAPVNYEIVTLAVREVSVDRLQHTGALADVHQLIALGISIEVLVAPVGLDVQHRDVRVEKQRNPVERRTAARLHPRRKKMPVVQRLILVRLVSDLLHPPHRLDGCRRVDVIEQRGGSVKAFVSHELLGVQAAVGLSKHYVPLPWDGAECAVIRHRYLSLRIESPDPRRLRGSPAVPVRARWPRTMP